MKDWRLLTGIALMAAGVAFPESAAHAQTSAVAGTWTLAQVNGQPLPVVSETTANCEEVVPSGTLNLEADGAWSFDYLERETCGTTVEEDREEEEGDYSVNGERVVFSEETKELDPDDIEIDELGIGAVNGNELRVTLQDGQTVLLFRR